MEQINSKTEEKEEGSGDEMSYEQFLVYSARCGELEDVKEMLAVQNPRVNINYCDNTMSMNTALHMAAANGHIDIAKALLADPDINLDVVNETKNTALHYAAFNGKKEIVILLIKQKADTNIKNEFDRTPIEEALTAGWISIGDILAPVTKFEEGKMYASRNPADTDEIPEGEEYEGLFPDDDDEDVD